MQTQNDVTDINLALKAGARRAHAELSPWRSVLGAEEEKDGSNHPLFNRDAAISKVSLFKSTHVPVMYFLLKIEKEKVFFIDH